MKKIYFLAYFIFISNFTWAIKGQYAEPKHNLQSICKISFWYFDGDRIQKGTCSSSYLGNKSFVTANHCNEGLSNNLLELKQTPNFPEPTVECPGLSPLPIWNNSSINQAGLSYSQDLAFFKTNIDPKIPPLKVAYTSEEVESLLENNECYLSGYGLDNEGKYGELKTVKTLGYSPKVYLGNYNPYMFEIIGQNKADNGDSGGACFCYDSNGEPILTGAIHGAYSGSNTKVEQLTQSKELIELYLKFDQPDFSNFKKIQQLNFICERTEECSKEMEVMGELSHQMKEVLEKLVQETKKNKQLFISTNNIEINTIDHIWEEILKFFEANHCYERLNK